MRIVLILFFILPMALGRVVELNGTVGEEGLSCSFTLQFKKMNMKVNLKKSKASCMKPESRFEVTDYTIQHGQVEFKLNMVVLKSGKVKIMKAKAKKYDGGNKEEIESISPLGLPSFWTKETKVEDVRGNVSVNKQERMPDYGYACRMNEWDGHQWCLCKPGQKIASIKSWHDNDKEDRQWDLECKDIPNFIQQGTHKKTTANDWDGTVHWDGLSDNSFLVGMGSEHDNHREDRKFTFMHTRSDMWYRSGPCRGWMFVNEYDGYLEINTLDDEVIVGLHSWHDNHREDRRWQAVICKLKSKCAQEGNLEVDLSKVKYSNEKSEFAYFSDIDASGSATSIKETVSLTQSTLDGMTGTEHYERTSGHKFNAGFSITNSVGISIKKIFDASGSVTFSAGYEYSTDTKFSRSKSTKFEEGKHGQNKWDVECLSRHICKLKVEIKTVTATAPYKINAGSQCIEEGYVKIENALSGTIIKQDTHVGPGSTICEDDGRYATNCPSWATWACTGRHESFMRQYCAKSCKFCI